MSLMSKKKLFYIDSRMRLSGTDSNFSYFIDIANEEFDHVCLLQANIPKSYYLVQNNRNTFTLRENGVSATITVPEGNYNRTSIKNKVQALLIADSPNGYTYTISIPSSTQDPDTGKFTFVVTNNSGVQPEFIFGDYLFEVLGFQEGSTNQFSLNTLESSNVVKLQLEDSVYIHSDMVTNGSDNILQEIFSSDIGDFSNIIYQCQDVEAYCKAMTTTSANNYHFYLTDEEARPIDLNGLNIVFTLVLFKQQNVFEMLRQVMKLKLIENN